MASASEAAVPGGRAAPAAARSAPRRRLRMPRYSLVGLGARADLPLEPGGRGGGAARRARARAALRRRRAFALQDRLHTIRPGSPSKPKCAPLVWSKRSGGGAQRRAVPGARRSRAQPPSRGSPSRSRRSSRSPVQVAVEQAAGVGPGVRLVRPAELARRPPATAALARLVAAASPLQEHHPRPLRRGRRCLGRAAPPAARQVARGGARGRRVAMLSGSTMRSVTATAGGRQLRRPSRLAAELGHDVTHLRQQLKLLTGLGSSRRSAAASEARARRRRPSRLAGVGPCSGPEQRSTRGSRNGRGW